MTDAKSVTVWSKVQAVDALAELALNLHWSWNHAADELWKHLDAELWEETQNPWVILQTVSKDKIESALATPKFRQRVENLLDQNRQAYDASAWFQKKYPRVPITSIAYFSMEFMLTEALPIYSGGLGNVAGDQLKAASDLGVPVVGVGILYGQGYFRQSLDAQGRQQALYPVNDPGQLPIRPLRQPNGEWLRFQIQMPDSKIWLRCWEGTVGRTKLYLLDSDDFANSAAHRCITGELYGGDAEMRLRQEIILGVGGWRMLRALGIKPEVCHLNEGHAAFAVLERARCYMEDYKQSFDLALNVTRAGNVFTTHTAVAAGFDRFSPELMRKYLSHYAQDELAISLEHLLALGTQRAGDPWEPFNMAYLAVRGSSQVNGVSKLHAQVSRQIFQTLFPRWPQHEVPIGAVTNGIHVPTWDSAEADALWTAACGKQRWRGDNPVSDKIRQVPDAELWRMRNEGRKTLVNCIRERYGRQTAAAGGKTPAANRIFDKNILTMGFARRFATYKRPNLLLHDPERLVRILAGGKRPVQLVLAGKAHPQDLPGQALVELWHAFLQRPEVRGRVVFLTDYDMLLAQEIVHGIDLWINTPRRPWEACGTSGMKVLVNGGLNLSELDGWWAEAYSPEVGWGIGDRREHGEDPAWDAQDADALYTLLEDEIIPEFYERDASGFPVKWLGRIRESMARLTPEFSASRAIRQYTGEHYLPAASAYADRATGDSNVGAELLQWQQNIARYWNTLRFGAVDFDTHDGRHFFRAEVFTGSLDPHALRVELYANPVAGSDQSIAEMTPNRPSANLSGARIYSAEVSATRPASDYTPRIVPHHVRASVPLEAQQILWQR